MAWVISEITPSGVMGLVALIVIIKPYSGVEVKILVPIVHRAMFFTLLLSCAPYGVNGRIVILVPMV